MARPFNRQWLATNAGLARRPGSRWTAGGGGAAFHPSDLASYYADYDADLGVETTTGVPATDGQTVQRWLDQASGAAHAVQNTAANRPTYEVGDGPNGRNRIYFNQVTAAKFMDATGVSITSAHTHYVVARPDTPLTTSVLVDGITARRAIYKSGSNFFLFAGSNACNTGVPTSGNWFVDEAIFNGASSSHRLNADAAVTGNPGAANLTGLRIAGPNGTPTLSISWSGDVARVLIFNAALSVSDRALVRAYLASLYGVTV